MGAFGARASLLGPLAIAAIFFVRGQRLDGEDAVETGFDDDAGDPER